MLVAHAVHRFSTGSCDLCDRSGAITTRRHGRQQCRLRWEVRPPGPASACASSLACSSWCLRARTCRRALGAAWSLKFATRAGVGSDTLCSSMHYPANVSAVRHERCRHNNLFFAQAPSAALNDVGPWSGLRARQRADIHRRGDNCQRRHRRAGRGGEQGRCRGFLFAPSPQRHLHLLALCSPSGGCAVLPL